MSNIYERGYATICVALVYGFRYKKETAIRISIDGTTTKLKDENYKLRKEKNKPKYDVDRITRERKILNTNYNMKLMQQKKNTTP